MHALLTIESPRLCLLGSRSHPIGNLDGGTSASNHHKIQCFALNYASKLLYENKAFAKTIINDHWNVSIINMTKQIFV